jgi:NADPH-dependent glutamate synthase beta subunit-like oxidoreductase
MEPTREVGGAGPRTDVTPLPDLRHAHAATGPVRTRRPVYLDLLAPCNTACPAGENIQGWLAHAQAGDHEAAWRVLVQDNPFPAIHGRVCYHPCESACNRLHLDSAVSIHGVERFLGDLALERAWELDRPATSTGRRVLVVGGGPSGLSAAYHLARLGHDVEVRDAGDEPGGMMRYGIPAYRLPRDVLDGEIARLTALGVRITTGHRVLDLVNEQREGAFDAVFVAVGAHLSKRVDIPAREAGRIVDAVSFLRGVASGEHPSIGRRVAVYGGGNTAFDAARVARRLGASDAVVVYRRTRDRMPANEEEAQDAEREGVRVNWLRTITAFDGPQLTVEVMELDDEGRPQGTGRFETLAADAVILALGQDTDTGFLRRVPGVEFTADGTVRVSASLMTGHAGLFAGGDMVPSERTVTVGVGHGRTAARHIDAYLRSPAASVPPVPGRDVATFDLLHPWYFGDAARAVQAEREPGQRVGDFTEVVGGLDAAQATYEARRCLSCGTCFECDGCLGACPEDAVIKLGTGHRYRFDYARCTGCGTCYEQCPVHAIEMVAEPTVKTENP